MAAIIDAEDSHRLSIIPRNANIVELRDGGPSVAPSPRPPSLERVERAARSGLRPGGGQAPSTTDALREQSARAEQRIRSLQAEADRLAARARAVFGDLRRLGLDRTIQQEELQIAERVGSRHDQSIRRPGG